MPDQFLLSLSPAVIVGAIMAVGGFYLKYTTEVSTALARAMGGIPNRPASCRNLSAWASDRRHSTVIARFLGSRLILNSKYTMTTVTLTRIVAGT
jgi:hypothetical protein